MPSEKRKWIWKTLGTLLVVALAAAFVFTFGRVKGVEFSPKQFRARSFSYIEIPVLRIQVAPIRRYSQTHDLFDYLRQNQFVSSTTSDDSNDWDLVTVDRHSHSAAGDASIFYRAMSMNLRGSTYWLGWSKEHQDSAKRLWPEVQRLAEKELYFLVPELLETVAVASDDAFEKELDEHLARVLQFHGATQQELGNHRNAVELFDEAFRHYSNPDDPRAKDAREMWFKSKGIIQATDSKKGDSTPDTRL